LLSSSKNVWQKAVVVIDETKHKARAERKLSDGHAVLSTTWKQKILQITRSLKATDMFAHSFRPAGVAQEIGPKMNNAPQLLASADFATSRVGDMPSPSGTWSPPIKKLRHGMRAERFVRNERIIAAAAHGHWLCDGLRQKTHMFAGIGTL
jgi:hypothetical protein